MTAQIIQFPVRNEPKICDDCRYFLCGPTGAYCNYWREDIFDETVAEECETFTRD